MISELMILAHKLFDAISHPTSIVANACDLVSSTIASNNSCVLWIVSTKNPFPKKRSHIPDLEVECPKKKKDAFSEGR